jgi:hypothetical protein
MALDQQKLKYRRIKGLRKIITDLRIHFKEMAALGIDIDQHMHDIFNNLDLLLIKLGYVPKEPYTGPERRSRDRPVFRNQCRIIQNGENQNFT